MRFYSVLASTVLAFFLTSCTSNASGTHIRDTQTADSSSRLEFIGFALPHNEDTAKVLTFNTEAKNKHYWLTERPEEYWTRMRRQTALKRFGTLLQEKNIAHNSITAYRGDFSPESLRAYTAKKRFLTYIRVEDLSVRYAHRASPGDKGRSFDDLETQMATGLDMIASKGESNALIGAGMATEAAAESFALAALSGIPSKTDYSLHSTFTVVVYDTQKQETVSESPPYTEEFQDSYTGYYAGLIKRINKTQESYASSFISDALAAYATLADSTAD